MTTNELFVTYRRAEYYAREEAWGEAVTDAQAVVDAAPEDRAARELLARALFHTASLGRAREQLEWLLERDPADAYARELLARVHERRGEHAEAVRHRRLLAVLTGHAADADPHRPMS